MPLILNVTNNTIAASIAAPQSGQILLSAGDVARPTIEVDGGLPVRQVDAMFQADRALRAVVVRDGPARLLLTRSACEFLLAGRYGYGRSVYGRRQVNALLNRDDLTLPALTPLPLAAQLLLARDEDSRYDDVLVTWSDGRVGMITVSDVFRTLADCYLDLATAVTASLQTAAAGVEQLTKEAQYVAQAASSAAADAEIGLWAADRSGETIGVLGVWRQEIDGVVELVGSVARTTKLLALNATIEAGRAGSAGAGFAAIAHEVKGLANRTGDETARVARQTVSMAASVDEASESVAEVIGTIRRMSDSLTVIASAVEQQALTTQHVAWRLADEAAGVSHIAGSASMTLG